MQKRLLPYLRRAEELDPHEPLAAFYCRLYVAEELMKSRASGDRSCEDLLVQVLDTAEAMKGDLAVNISDDGPRLYEEFCRQVFESAKQEEMDGVTGNMLATRYYYATLFFDVMGQFGALPSDIESARNLCRQKIMQIKRGTSSGSTSQSDAKQLCQQALLALDSHSVDRARQLLTSAISLLG